MMSGKFWIRICSDLDYEEMVADICYENGTIGMITQEEGISNMAVEIFCPHGKYFSIKFPLEDFLTILQKAKDRLIYMEKLPEETGEPNE